MRHDVEVLVIGAGAIGISSAHYLRARGFEVSVIDAGPVGAGCSYGNAGLVVPSHSVPLAAPGIVGQALGWMFDPESPFYIRPRADLDLVSWLWRFWRASTESQMRRAMPLLRDLGVASLRLFDELAALDGVEFAFERRGLLSLYRTEAGLDHSAADAELLRGIGIESRVVGPGEVRDLLDGMEVRVHGGVLYPNDAHLQPAMFVRSLAGHVERGGGEIRPGVEVLDFAIEGRRIAAVRTTRGDFTARQVVLAAGSWSPPIARRLGLKLPIQGGKGYSITFRRPERCPPIPMTLGEARVGVTPMADTLRFAGTLELAGLDRTIDPRRVRAILRAIPVYLPELAPERLELVEIWRGLRPCTPDGLPLVGRPRAWDNLVLAAGHAMVGISLGPITGKLVAEVVAGDRPSIDIGLLDPDRFA
jgi:D-amino-acid dehydrogenase